MDSSTEEIFTEATGIPYRKDLSPPSPPEAPCCLRLPMVVADARSQPSGRIWSSSSTFWEHPCDGAVWKRPHDRHDYDFGGTMFYTSNGCRSWPRFHTAHQEYVIIMGHIMFCRWWLSANWFGRRWWTPDGTGALVAQEAVEYLNRVFFEQQWVSFEVADWLTEYVRWARFNLIVTKAIVCRELMLRAFVSYREPCHCSAYTVGHTTVAHANLREYLGKDIFWYIMDLAGLRFNVRHWFLGIPPSVQSDEYLEGMSSVTSHRGCWNRLCFDVGGYDSYHDVARQVHSALCINEAQRAADLMCPEPLFFDD